MDTGDDGCCVASTTGNYSAIQDHVSGWYYTFADREGYRGRRTYGVSIFTLPVAVAMQSRAVVQVMVYSQ